MSMNEKVAIVTGGSRGIGSEIVLSMAGKGVKVAFTYIKSTDAADELLNKTKGLPGMVRGYKTDIKNRQEVKSMVADVIREWGKIDILVNNAGVRRDKTLAFMSDEEWEDVLQTNLSGTFNMTKAIVFDMVKKKKGRIINIGSISGLYGIAGQTNYSSTKAALMGFTKSLAKEVAPYGISVNIVAPGGVETDMTKDLAPKDREKLVKGVPMGRMCSPSEVAQVVLYLADDELCPAYLTGAMIPLDGGYGL